MRVGIFFMANYCFNQDDFEKKREYNEDSYRNVVGSCIFEMNGIMSKIADYINLEEVELAVNELINLQQAAIDLGTYTEMVKGKGYDIVNILELFCEDIFVLSEQLRNCSILGNQVNEEIIEKAFSLMDQRFETITALYDLREEVVFICLRPEYFKSYSQLFNEAISDPNKDVYLIPIPWYKKNNCGIREQVFLYEEGYPKDAIIYNYRDYLLHVHEPETIYIQYERDQYDDSMDIFEEYYSLNLRRYTNNLILVPYYEMPKFSEEDRSFYYSMKYYVTMPGVICADKVLLHDEWNKELYIKKLTEFAGEGTKGIWENKIDVVEKPSDVGALVSVSDIKKAWDGFRENLGDVFKKPNGDFKKIILFQPIFSIFYEYGTNVICKIKRNLDVFKSAEDDIVLLWLEQLPLKTDLDKLNMSVAEEYRNIVNEFISEERGIFLSDVPSKNKYDISSFIEHLEAEGNRKGATIERIAIEISDAYYGDSDYVARQFALEKKPVMIQNVEI